MARKRYTKQEGSPETLKIREKRKWQIALRRYVLEKLPCTYYAPYFGLDITTMRSWFESQFKPGVGWDDFGVKWQFDHIIPVAYFDFSREEELKSCWGFPNLRVEHLDQNKEAVKGFNMLAARNFFKELWEKTSYAPLLYMLNKLDELELSEILSITTQEAFLKENKEYLAVLNDYGQLEFELLNSGKNTDEIKKETDFLKNLGK
ncbi:MAG: hypothetical protein HYZ15_15435 [Sphingobacteriales bacterium]|nr:hypothetical protein [Sphingobacteriales bacterium]